MIIGGSGMTRDTDQNTRPTGPNVVGVFFHRVCTISVGARIPAWCHVPDMIEGSVPVVVGAAGAEVDRGR
jgi:hypothetical protein